MAYVHGSYLPTRRCKDVCRTIHAMLVDEIAPLEVPFLNMIKD